MIYIYDKKTKYNDALLKNGLYSLDNLTIEATTTEDLNGNYELKMTLELLGNVPGALYDMLEVDNIIKVLDETSEELFRIAQVERGMDQIEIYARHITIADSLNLWLDNVRPTNMNGMAALQHLASKTIPKCNIIFSSNLSNTSTADYVRKNLYDALFEGENAFINRWGGEVKRTGYTVKINDKIGVDKSKNIRIKEALNLTNFDIKSNIDEVHTVIYPIGHDGIIGPKVESKMINNYSMPLPIELKYDDVKLRKVNEQGEVEQEGYATEEEAKEELRRRAQEEFDKRHVDQIQLVCNVDYVDLSKYEEYKDIAQLQTTNIGDDVSVYIDTFGIDIKARVVTRVHDVLRNKRIENTLSTDGALRKPVDINKIIEDLKDKIEGEGFEDLSGYIDSMIQQGFKNGYLIYDKNAMYAVDALPKEKAKNVVVVNKNGLGYSANGIGGPYTYGFTIDGKLNADMITVGAMSGQYIKGGTIEANKLTTQAKKEISDGFTKNQKFINLTADVDGLSSTVGDVQTNVNGQNAKISKIEQKAGQIELSVQNKVGKDDVINSINLSQEGIKIKANKLEVTGKFVTKSDLKDGVTVISGDNIKTGTIDAMRITGADIQGTKILYMASNGTMACDGNTYIKNFRVPETRSGWKGIGTFSVGPIGYFDKSVYANDWVNVNANSHSNGYPVVANYDPPGKWLDVKALSLNRPGGSTSLLVRPWNNPNDFWIPLNLSDAKLKENIRLTDTTTSAYGGNKIGLELVNSIPHKSFNFIGFDNTYECGYIAQDLKKINTNIVEEHEQQDGSTLMGPRLDALVPNITLAIQQQQKIIESLEARIKELESKLK